MADSDIETGAGAFEAGAGLAGWDPAPDPSTRPLATRVAAPKFDPLTRRYVMTAEGGLEDEHPTMARARHLLGIRRRGLPSTPGSGIPLAGLRRARPESRQREAEDAVARALKPLLDDQDVRVDGVTLSSPWDGTIYTDLKNLRAPDDPPTRIASQLED